MMLTVLSRLIFLAMLSALTISCAQTPRADSLPDARAQGRALAKSCEGRDGWSDAAPPARIHGSTYYVGTCGISVLLIAGDLEGSGGHVLIDGATQEAAPSILANIRQLGFDPRDVRIIVGSHEHLDHMGGFAALKAATGARLLVREPARQSLETGEVDGDDPQAGLISGMKPVKVDGIVEHGDVVRLGGIALTAHATPGHTSGGTSWSWQSCEAGRCVSIAYLDSMTAISRDGYRFTDHPGRVAPYRETFARARRMPCDLMLAPHPDWADSFARLAGAAPLIDPAACTRLVDAMEARLDARLAQEARPQ